MRVSNELDLVEEEEGGIQVAFWSLPYTITCRYN